MDIILQEIKSYRLIIVSTLIYLLFYSFFENIFTSIFVNPILSNLSKSIWNDSIIAVIFGFVVLNSIISIRRNTFISYQKFWITVVLLFTINYYRFISDCWTFTEFELCSNIKYIDVISVYLLSIVLLRVLFKEKKFEKNDLEGFCYDNPIANSAGDTIGREKFAKNLVKRIINTANEESAFAVGIASEWGNGKTSFFKLIQDNLPPENRVVVKFNPWLNNNEKSVIISFFDQLSDELKPYNKELSNEILKYAELLSSIEDSRINNLVNFYVKLINEDDSLNARFNKIKDAIKASGKQIVIFIDDLDRLYEGEIVEVLKLIRNSANFSNTVFIVAYDRNFIINAIRKVNEYKPHKFLEKIFQLEFTLPIYEHYVIQNYLKEQISPHLSDTDKRLFMSLFEEKTTIYFINIFRYDLLRSMRDVNRFINSFIFSYGYLKGEVYLLDLLNLELLRTKYLSVYDLIVREFDTFFTTIDGYNNQYDKFRYYVLSQINTEKGLKDNMENKSNLINIKNSDNPYEDVYFNLKSNKSKLELYLFENYLKLGLSVADIIDVLEHIYAVFPYTFTTSAVNLHNLSVRHPSCINRYFHNSLLSSNISEIEFSIYRRKSYEDFSSKVKLWVRKGLISEVKRKLEQINDFSDKYDFEKTVRVIFDLATLRTTEEEGIVNFNQQNLYKKLQLKQNKLLFNNIDEYKNLLLDIFKSQKSPFDFSRQFIDEIFRDVGSRDNWEFIIPKQDLINLNLWNFNMHALQIDKIDKSFFYLFNSCRYKEWQKVEGSNSYNQKIILPEEAKVLFMDHASTKIESFIKNIIAKFYNSSNTDESHNYSILFETVLDVWSSWGSFEKFINSYNENQIFGLTEFKDFYYKCKMKEFRYIEYHFKDLDLSDAVLFENS